MANLNKINWSRNTDKAVNGLLGILSGITADRRLNELEVLFLDVWLKSNQHLSNDPDAIDLIDLISDILSDGVVTQDELSDLQQLCQDIREYKEVERYEDEKLINEFIGLLKGVTADGIVNPKEFSFIQNWIRQHKDLKAIWPIDPVYQRMTDILSDNHISSRELKEFAELLKALTGSRFEETGAADGSATEFFVNEVDEIDFNGRFCFTGTFVSGQRSKLKAIAEANGATVKKSVSAQLDYLVVGSVATRDWMYSSHGRKIEQALKLQKDGHPIVVLSENAWFSAVSEIE